MRGSVLAPWASLGGLLRSTVAVLLLALPASACDEPVEAPAPAAADLPPGVVARVGGADVALLTIARIAAQQKIGPKDAVLLAVYDALLAEGASGALPASEVDSAHVRVRAHALLRSLWLELRDQPITDAELDEATHVFWSRYDRPEGRRVVHAVAMFDQQHATAQDKEAAKEHARRVVDAVGPAAEDARRTAPPPLDEESMFIRGAGYRDAASKRFQELAKSVKQGSGKFQVRVEELPPLTEDAMGIAHGTDRRDPMGFDVTFVRAVYALDDVRGALSEVVETQAGFHVIMLVEVTPGKHLTRDERIEKLGAEIRRVRAMRAQRTLLGELGTRRVEVAPNVPALLSQVVVTGEDDPARQRSPGAPAVGTLP